MTTIEKGAAEYVMEHVGYANKQAAVAAHKGFVAGAKAEQKTTVKMRNKAIAAFKFACTDNYGGECWANDDHHVKCSGQCVKMNDFIQKLNEK